jgi:serine/threonine-protein phosphatase 2B catalytic subunit
MIKKVNRFTEIPKNGGFCDLMWADPIDHSNGIMDELQKDNDIRGCSYFFGF